MYDSKIFRSIYPLEFIKNSWGKPQENWSPNLLHAAKRFNELGLWCGTMILTPEKPKARAQRIEKFIQLAEVETSELKLIESEIERTRKFPNNDVNHELFE